MKTKLLTTRMPAEVEMDINRLAKEEKVQKTVLMRELFMRGLQDLKEEYAFRLYAKGKITLWKASEMAGLSLWETLEKAREKKIPIVYDLGDAKEDIKMVLDNL